MARRSVAWTILFILLCVADGQAQQNQQAQPRTPARVTIRVYDYAGISPELLARARDLVAGIYDSAGVAIRWTTTIDAPAQLAVIILSPSMARRIALQKDVVGIAATATGETGHIAYVFFDGVRRVASAADRDEMEILALVMAHELGHLLLPHGSHSISGLMRPEWSIGDLRVDHGQFEFTGTQAERIRQSFQR